MSPRQAATVIGCSVQQVRHLIRVGRLEAKRVIESTITTGSCGYHYDVSQKAIDAYLASHDGRGWPRGVSRKKV